MKHFQLQCLHDEFALSKPEVHFIALFYTFRGQPDPVIQICQLISPFFSVIMLLQFFQNRNAFFQADILRLIQLILQNISSCISGSNTDKFLVIFDCLNKLAHFYGQFTEGIYNGSSIRVTFIRHQEDFLAFLKTSVDLI